MSGHRFPYKWQKTDLARVKPNGLKVFSTFACGGGSDFGYEMIGCDVLGINEIDKEMVAFYKVNHQVDHVFHEPIQTFKLRDDLPKDLFNLDIFSGSPPCSTFSMSGFREAAWGKEKKFKEGQSEQVLSDLFFDYLDVVEKLRPKVAIAENVKGMISGKAKGYCRLVLDRFRDLGYEPQLFLLNAASMGVPQMRERVFFIARRKELQLKPLVLNFDEKPITFGEVAACLPFQDLDETKISDAFLRLWEMTRQGGSFCDVLEAAGSSRKLFNSYRLSDTSVCFTLTAVGGLYHPTEVRAISSPEVCLIGSYPYDYDFLGENLAKKIYVIGMSVPPVMMAQIAAQVAEQFFGVSGDSISEAWR